ncbi:arsenic resistance protein ArsH [Pyronema domesticum]|uniref:Similar to FMN-dependent NADPH-azoreductase acc. no. O07529 n=1 Tax=Pyronema omphalodes (strain CBS 100304) TaxID=1076935 RepID=U4LLM5_PYROM|nr:arsenic resistance protein ArsH [Pyronema domesticum]CCX32487.1 Similar to FMN-dependent NADPH-azoreductase; acc. no. O07529 [Pyronema omphalodes CBS 100304]
MFFPLRTASTLLRPLSRTMTTLTNGASTPAMDPYYDPEISAKYRPFILPAEISEKDWISELELDSVTELSKTTENNRLKFLVLYGSLRHRSFSRLMAYEASRILYKLGADVRVFDPTGLPIKDDDQHDHPKVQELRKLSAWSDGHVWCSPEQHGNLTAVFKNQIDWIPLQTGSVRPTQGRTLGVIQVNGGSQSFNTVNSLRILGRWMRMWTIPNQSSLPAAWTQFTEPDAEFGGNRLMPSGNRDRLVDCMEELVRFTTYYRPYAEGLVDRFSERKERKQKEEKLAKAKAEAAKEAEEKAAKELEEAQKVAGQEKEAVVASA